MVFGFLKQYPAEKLISFLLKISIFLDVIICVLGYPTIADRSFELLGHSFWTAYRHRNFDNKHDVRISKR